MKRPDFDEVGELIHLSTNTWYLQRIGHRIFQNRPEDCRLFCEVYEDLDPGCSYVVENPATGRIVGSCFYHPRETHASLGIMNVHPSYFGRGVAGQLLRAIIDESEERDLPLRLVSSALNLDSYSLYNRYGFTPFAVYQDMLLHVPEEGIPAPVGGLPEVRLAQPADVVGMGKLEFEVAGISRERDYCYFIENKGDIWHTLVTGENSSDLSGFLVSVEDPGCTMIGPGVARDSAAAEALLRGQLDRFRGKAVVFLVPVGERELIDAAYAMGARNCELHFGQIRGEGQPVNGIVMPSFLPESA